MESVEKMSKIFKTVAFIIAACMLSAVFAACVEAPSPDGGDEEPSALSEYGLADLPASIDITTDGGVAVEGTPNKQPYYGCTVAVTDGRAGENFEGKRAQVRVRGNNTAEYDKKSFRLKFDAKINLLGLNGGKAYKSWVLLACYKDVTFLRDAVVFEFAKKTLKENGLYSSDYAFAEVSVNGEYNGLYMVAEQQQVNKSRIDIAEPAEGYEGVDIGYLVEYDGNAPSTEEVGSYFRLSYDGYSMTCEDGTVRKPAQFPFGSFAYYTVKNDMYGSDPQNTEQLKFITSYVENVFKIMYDAIYLGEYTTFNTDYTAIVPSGFTDARSTVEAVADIPSMVDMFILQEIACDNDVDFSSFFFSVDMSADGNKKLTFQAPWDFDSGLGMMDGLERLDKLFTPNVSTNAVKGLNPWLALPAHAEWFMGEVADRWNELAEKGVFERIVNLIDVVAEGYESAFVKNYEKWDNLGKKVDPVQSDTVTTFTTHGEACAYLKNWLQHRIDFLTGYFGGKGEEGGEV